ncbi:hypothetical protein, partial [Salinimicrobium oceani]
VYEYLYRIDTDKVALVKYLGDNEVGFVERTEEVLNEIKCMIKEPLNIMVLFIYAQFKIEDFFSIAVPEIKKAEYQMIINAFDLERLVFYWDIESLSLWKYARARERFESEGRQIMPFYSNLTYFKWYMGNSESFFPIDDRAPDVLIFDYSMQGSIIIEAEQKKDKHLVQ